VPSLALPCSQKIWPPIVVLVYAYASSVSMYIKPLKYCASSLCYSICNKCNTSGESHVSPLSFLFLFSLPFFPFFFFIFFPFYHAFFPLPLPFSLCLPFSLSAFYSLPSFLCLYLCSHDSYPALLLLSTSLPPPTLPAPSGCPSCCFPRGLSTPIILVIAHVLPLTPVVPSVMCDRTARPAPISSRLKHVHSGFLGRRTCFRAD
jgi:hypothetical protein